VNPGFPLSQTGLSIQRIVVLIAAITSAALPAPARGDECDVLTAKVVQATGARFERRSPSGANVFLQHPLAKELRIQCRQPGLTAPDLSMSAYFDGAYPPMPFFDLVAVVAYQAMGLPRGTVREAALRCHRAALRDRDEMGQIDQGRVRVECKSFHDERHGGATVIFVYPHPR
jgi:hypothetical protein